MEITETRSASVTTLALAGRLDGISSPALETKIDGLVAAGARRLIIDGTRLAYVSSAGLRVFLSTAKKLRTAGGSVAFAALQPSVYEVFELSGFTVFLETHPTLSAAVARPE